MLGMLAIGFLAGVALGGYAVSQRAQLQRISTQAHRMGERLTMRRRPVGTGPIDDQPEEPAARSTRFNHRQKTTAAVLE